jgi:hypothetical protein
MVPIVLLLCLAAAAPAEGKTVLWPRCAAQAGARPHATVP